MIEHGMHRVIIALSLLFPVHFACAGDIISTLEQQLRAPESLFLGVVAEKEQQLAVLKEKKKKLESARQETDALINTHISEIRTQIDLTQTQLKKAPDDEYLRHRLALLNEIYQVLKEQMRVRDAQGNIVDEYIKLLVEFIEDPNFITFQKERRLNERLYYSFEDLRKLYEVIVDQEKRVEQLGEQERNAAAELDNTRRILAATSELYKKKKDEIDAASRLGMPSAGKYEAQQALDILTLEEQLYEQKRSLEEVKLKVSTLHRGYVDMQLFVARGRLNVLRDYVRRIKPSVRVSDADISQAQDELSKKKQAFFATKELQSKELEQFASLRKTKEKELEVIAAKYKIPLGRDLDEWSVELKFAVDWLMAYCEIATVNAQLLLLQKKVDLVDAQVGAEDEKFKYESMQVRAKETYHKIIARKFITEEEINQEIKSYDASKADARSIVSRYKEKVAIVPDLLNNRKKVIDNIKAVRQEIQKQRDSLFAIRQKEFTRCMGMLRDAEEYVSESVDIIGKLTGVYSGISATAGGILRLVDFIIAELRSITFWYRPDYAISWKGVSNMVPDTMTFLADIRSYIVRLSPGSLLVRLGVIVKQPMSLMLLIFKLLFVAIAMLAFKRFSGAIASLLAYRAEGSRGLVRMLRLLAMAAVSFVSSYFWGIFIWSMLFAALMFYPMPDTYFYVFFYLGSIPYLLYLANRFMRSVINFNTRHGYVLLAEDFQRRFTIVVSPLLYATIIITLFREAFMLVNYYGSELPTILLAVNFIIFQIALILLISKEQIINLIPAKDATWQWVREQVNNYFYHLQLLVIAVIVMSNPYVGFGQLVLYSLVGFIYTGILITALVFLHGFFKKIISRVFFTSEDDVVRERFPHAKTWFGIIIIASFMMFVLVGIVVGAKIWGWPLTYADVYSWLDKPIVWSGSKTLVSFRSIFTVFGFVLAGYLVSYALNKYVLDKIFDLLLVDAGVQHTVTSITGYMVFVIALFLGLQSVGLGELVGWAIAALTFSLGWVLKDPISDFAAYFVILVQRPIKIGDYIKIDDETRGVVRKITARSVMLRRKNSTTIVVPNSYVLGHSVINWNYVRGFIAFDDIVITVDYREDPALVKSLFTQVVESHPNILRTPKPVVRLESFAEHGYEFMVRGFMSSSYTLDQWDIASDIRFSIAKAMRDHNIKIALPIRVIDSRRTGQGMAPQIAQEIAGEIEELDNDDMRKE